MKRAPGALSPRRVRSVYATFAGLWLTGFFWLLFHYFLQRQTPFGTGPHPLESWWLTLHGAFAFLGLWGFGLLWDVHIAQRWRASRRRWSGGIVVGLLIWFAVSGYLLYYLGDETARALASLGHWIIGLAAPVALLLHRAPSFMTPRAVATGNRRGSRAPRYDRGHP